MDTTSKSDQDILLLEGLLNQYSPSYQEGPAVNFLVEMMNKLGYDSHIDGMGNAVGSLGHGTNHIILLGHIDTVPGQIQVRCEGDILWGRGSVDAKGPLACFTSAAAKCAIPDGWKITVIGAVAEEADSRGAYYIVDKYRPQAVVIGEPSGWDRITLGYKGSIWIELTTKRPIAHTAAKAESACDAAFNHWSQLLGKINLINADKNKIFDQISPSLREISSLPGEFEGQASLKFNLRLPPGQSVDSIQKMVCSTCEDADVKFTDGIEAYRAEKNSGLVRAFLSSIRSCEGTPVFNLKTGTSDMNVVGPVWGCPILAYGPGDSNLDHTPNEHILISEYKKSITILTDALEKLMAY